MATMQFSNAMNTYPAEVLEQRVIREIPVFLVEVRFDPFSYPGKEYYMLRHWRVGDDACDKFFLHDFGEVEEYTIIPVSDGYSCLYAKEFAMQELGFLAQGKYPQQIRCLLEES